MNWVVGIAQGFLIVTFMMAGGMKLVKNDKAKAEHFGLSTGFMSFIGVCEVLGALGLLAGFWIPGLAALAAAGLFVVMVGAVMMNLRTRADLSHTLASVLVLILSALVLAVRF